MKKLILFIFLVSCSSSGPKSYRITTFKESGEINSVFEVEKVKTSPQRVEFDWNGAATVVEGSYKLEAIY